MGGFYFIMKKKNSSPLLGNILKKVAPKIGATIMMEPRWGVVGQITFKNGKKSYTRYNTVDMNMVGSSDVSRDKDYANFFMNKMGYPVIKGETFYSATWARAIGSKQDIDAGYKYAKKLGFPVVVKPNSGSQGIGVAIVHTKQEFYRAMRFVFKGDKVALVQEVVKGKDYRVVVLDKKIISAYERIPLSVTGDGKLSIEKLINKKKKYFNKINRDIKIHIEDPRIKDKLKRQGFNLKFVPAKGKQIYLLDNANLSQGGDSIDVTDSINSLFKKIAVNLTRDMGLRFCGVDFMIEGDIKDKPKKFFVIEVNSAPGLDHYVTTGKAQQKIVEDMYLKVLKSMQK